MDSWAQKKSHQLGMNVSTAQGRLVKDLLFESAKNTPCYRCGGVLTRETFTIEHKIPWLDSEDPVKLFFDLGNISFSHHACNMRAARRTLSTCGTENKYNKGCRCEPCKAAKAARMAKGYTPERRRGYYIKYGC